jgi:hypothetical protein
MLFLAPADLRGLQQDGHVRALEEILERRDLVVAFGEGEVRGLGSAALLFADYAVLNSSATLAIDIPEAWAAVVWRLGRQTLRWHHGGGQPAEVVDELTGQEPALWLAEWTGSRSVMALESAAALIRARGGDSLERAEFARLFAIGEPQTGLGAFLARATPSYSSNPRKHE